MSHASLAARYRPQSFAEVTGQDTVKTILSRAAAADRVAPAYLLSGTRGVGKTTIARIFAKALNCAQAPTADPCNQCPSCRHITSGNHVDVIEIDGASNRGIDDARRLREASAYAPMEGRYKVFIIDEAHMLTRDAFNALLKTLEEPPPRTTFILATTEPHKFPVTILSRCQHFTFTALSEAELVQHLIRVLQREGVSFEENAVRLLARRASGSVRDGMSLLGQTLALGGETLSEASTRQVLGLAGQEFFERLLSALHSQDCLAVVALTGELLNRGADLGFFLREFAVLWRSLFLIRHAGNAALAVLDLPETEKARLATLAEGFELSTIHASWQMVIEGQRQVLTSLEPGAALELLLLNLALLPRLLSVDLLSRSISGAAPLEASRPVPPAHHVPSAHVPSTPTRPGARPLPAPAPTHAPPTPARTLRPGATGAPPWASDDTPPPDETPPEPGDPEPPFSAHPTPFPQMPDTMPDMPPGTKDVPLAGTPFGQQNAEPQTRTGEARTPSADGTNHAEAFSGNGETEDASPAPTGSQTGASGEKTLDWEDFLGYCETRLASGSTPALGHLKRAKGLFTSDSLTINVGSSFQLDQFAQSAQNGDLRRLAEDYAGRALTLDVVLIGNPRRTEAELKKIYAEHPLVKNLEQTFGASLLRCTETSDPPCPPQT